MIWQWRRLEGGCATILWPRMPWDVNLRGRLWRKEFVEKLSVPVCQNGVPGGLGRVAAHPVLRMEKGCPYEEGFVWMTWNTSYPVSLAHPRDQLCREPNVWWTPDVTQHPSHPGASGVNATWHATQEMALRLVHSSEQDSVQDCHVALWMNLSLNNLGKHQYLETRLTVGTVKSLLDLHRLCAHDAIMIPYEAWTWNSFRLRGACDWPLQ